MAHLHPVLAAVTDRIRNRSAKTRATYLARIAAQNTAPKIQRHELGCANLAHVQASMDSNAKHILLHQQQVNIGIVTAYNEMLSAHQPYHNYPERIKQAIAQQGAVAQVAGGVPAMCDGITQGRAGMELSLFSRDTIAQATAISLSHDVFDGFLCLGVCDKIVPGLLIGALSFGHLPALFVPAGPMASGLSNKEKSRVREEYAAGRIGKAELLAAEVGAYHSVGTCNFYGTANSNQMLLDVMGLQLSGSAFVPHGDLRDCLTDAAARRVVELAQARQNQGVGFQLALGHIVDEACIVNAVIALLASGGSSNHTLHWIAVARAAGIILNWDDFSDLSQVIPLICKIYPNGSADVNAFHAAGGTPWLVRELLNAGLMHPNVHSVSAPLTANAQQAPSYCQTQLPVLENNLLNWREPAIDSTDHEVLRSANKPFAAQGGLVLLKGNIGRGVMKVSSVKAEHQVVRAPARIFDSQEALQAAYAAGQLRENFVAVVRFQGPRANGMPELHKLMPPLGELQNQGYAVALVTDGRLSGASGKVPAAIHVCPEALAGGAIAKIREGDWITVNAQSGQLMVEVEPSEWAARQPAQRVNVVNHGYGRELFGGMRQLVSQAEEGACTLFEPLESA